jgi:plasmid stabilization system protein ParE
MVYRIKIQPTAAAEIEEAYSWIAGHEPLHALRWLERLHQKVETLTQRPERCPLAGETTAFSVEVRELLFGRRRGVYRILFSISGDTVSILHVRHGARRFLDE